MCGCHLISHNFNSLSIYIFVWKAIWDHFFHLIASKKIRVNQQQQCSKSIWVTPLGLYILSAKTFYRKIIWSLEAAKFGCGFSNRSESWQVYQQQSYRDRHLGSSADGMPVKYQSDTIIMTWHPISRLWAFIRSCGKTSYRQANRALDKGVIWMGMQLLLTSLHIRLVKVYFHSAKAITPYICISYHSSKRKWHG